MRLEVSGHADTVLADVVDHVRGDGLRDRVLRPDHERISRRRATETVRRTPGRMGRRSTRARRRRASPHAERGAPSPVRHGLRGMDALHLASADAGGRSAARLRQLGRRRSAAAARAEGLELVGRNSRLASRHDGGLEVVARRIVEEAPRRPPARRGASRAARRGTRRSRGSRAPSGSGAACGGTHRRAGPPRSGSGTGRPPRASRPGGRRTRAPCRRAGRARARGPTPPRSRPPRSRRRRPPGSPGTAPKSGASSRRSGRPPTTTGRPPASATQAHSISPIGPAPTIATVSPCSHAGDVDPVQAARERLGHRGDLRREAGRDGEEVPARDPLGHEQQLGVRAVEEREEALAERLLPTLARRARSARGGVRDDDARPVATSIPQTSWPNGLGGGAEQDRVPTAVRLQVGAVGERHLDLEEHLALGRSRLGHVLEPQVAGAVEDERAHRPHRAAPRRLDCERRRTSSTSGYALGGVREHVPPSAGRSSGHGSSAIARARRRRTDAHGVPSPDDSTRPSRLLETEVERDAVAEAGDAIGGGGVVGGDAGLRTSAGRASSIALSTRDPSSSAETSRRTCRATTRSTRVIPSVRIPLLDRQPPFSRDPADLVGIVLVVSAVVRATPRTKRSRGSRIGETRSSTSSTIAAESRRAHAAGTRPRVGVTGTRQGVKTTLRASRRAKQLETVGEALEREDGRLGHVEVVEQRDGLGHVRRRGRARADDGQLSAVDVRRRYRAGVREDEHRAAGRDRARAPSSTPPRPQRTTASTGPSGARPARRGSTSTANTSSPRRSRTAPKSRPMKPLPTISTRPARHALRASRRTQASGSTIVPRQSGQSVRQLHPPPAPAHARRIRRAGSSAPRTARTSTRGPRGSARTRRRTRDGRARRAVRRRVSATTSWPSTAPA